MSHKQQMKEEYRQFKEQLETELVKMDKNDPQYKEHVRAIQDLSKMLR